MSRFLSLIAAGLLAGAVFLPMSASAAPFNTASMYRISVTKVGSNVYKVDDQPGLVINTAACVELALVQSVIYDDSTQTLYFGDDLRSAPSCSVRGVYRANLSLSRVNDTDNTSGYTYYQDLNGAGYLKTFGCYVYAYGERAVVFDDMVYFIDSRQSCQVSA
jgi:hypothetical protein